MDVYYWEYETLDKVKVIKTFRAAFDLGLKEAKDLHDRGSILVLSAEELGKLFYAVQRLELHGYTCGFATKQLVRETKPFVLKNDALIEIYKEET